MLWFINKTNKYKFIIKYRFLQSNYFFLTKPRFAVHALRIDIQEAVRQSYTNPRLVSMNKAARKERRKSRCAHWGPRTECCLTRFWCAEYMRLP